MPQTIQTNSVLPLTLNFPQLPDGVDPDMEAYLSGLQNTILKAYQEILKRLQVRPMVATFAQRPAAGTAGRMFYASDTVAFYVDDGTNWNLV